MKKNCKNQQKKNKDRKEQKDRNYSERVRVNDFVLLVRFSPDNM